MHGAVVGEGPTYMLVGVKKKNKKDLKRMHVFPAELTVWAEGSWRNEAYAMHAAMVHVGKAPSYSLNTGHYLAIVPLGCQTYALANDGSVKAFTGDVTRVNPYICVYKREAGGGVSDVEE